MAPCHSGGNFDQLVFFNVHPERFCISLHRNAGGNRIRDLVLIKRNAIAAKQPRRVYTLPAASGSLWISATTQRRDDLLGEDGT